MRFEVREHGVKLCLIGSRMRYLNAWLPKASHRSFWLFVLRTTAKSTEPDVSKGDGGVPIQSEVVLIYRHSWARSLEEPLQLARPSWRQPENETQNPLFLGDAAPATSVRSNDQANSEQRQDNRGTDTVRGAFGEGPFRGRALGGDITACTEPCEL